MMSLSQLKAPKGSRGPKKRVGRGQGSGWGKTAGRGAKGQKSRTGNMHFEGFEGGQMPLQRRMPKYGFHNPFRRDWAVINLATLEEHFEAGAAVDLQALKGKGLLKNVRDGVKLLAHGELSKALTVKVNRASEAARAAVEKAGGKLELVVDKELKVPRRGEGVRPRQVRERQARRVAKQVKA